MSLFSGMKISSGSGGRTDTEASSEETDTASEDRPSSAFGFIAGTKADTPSQKKLPSEQGSTQSKFQFINTNTSSDKVPVTKTTLTTRSRPPESDFDFNVDLDLDLDLELDPLRTGCKEATGLNHRKSDTDLEGIDFFADLDICPSGRDSQHEDEGKGRLTQEYVPKSDNVEVGSHSKQHQRTTHVRASQFGFISDSQPQEPVVQDETDNSGLSASSIDDECGTSPGGLKPTAEKASVEHGPEDIEVAPRRGELEGAGTSGSLYDLELDVSDMLEVLQEAQAAAQQQLRDAQEELLSQMESLGHQRITAMHSLIWKQERLNELHVLQAKAVSEEDYEKAEVLTNECTLLEEALSHIPSMTLHQEDAFQDVYKSSKDIEGRREDQRKQWAKSYQELLSQQEAVIVRVRGGRANDTSDEKKQRLVAQKAELDRTLGHVLLDKDHVTKREAQLLARVDEKTADLRETKQNLLTQKSTVQEEISALEKQLAKLRSEEAGLNDAISRQDEAIDAVRAGFKDDMSSIEEEKSKVEEQEDRLREEQRGVNEREKKMAEEARHFQLRITREENVLSTISEALGTLGSSSEQKEELSILDFGTVDVSLELQPSKDVICLREKLQGVTSDIQSTSALILSNQARLVTSKKKVIETEDHIATLQGAKQLAVTTKNFGEAKRVAEEIKVQMTEGQGYQAEVEALSVELKTDKSRVEDLQDQVEKMKTEVAEMENRWELSLLEKAGEVIMLITRRLEECGTGESTSNAALVCRTLEMERGMIALFISWLSDRHGLPRPSNVDDLIQGLETHEGDASENRAETEGNANEPTTLDEKSGEMKAELAELEERLQTAIEEEDYDAAEHIQARIDHLQQSKPASSM